MALAIAIQGLVFGEFHWVGLIGFSFGIWIIFSALLEPVRRLRQKQTLTAALLGMCIAHLGVGMFAIGASGVESYKIEKDVALKPGGSILTLTYLGGETVIPGYNVMGICKAALDAMTSGA